MPCCFVEYYIQLVISFIQFITSFIHFLVFLNDYTKIFNKVYFFFFLILTLSHSRRLFGYSFSLNTWDFVHNKDCKVLIN